MKMGSIIINKRIAFFERLVKGLFSFITIGKLP